LNTAPDQLCPTSSHQYQVTENNPQPARARVSRTANSINELVGERRVGADDLSRCEMGPVGGRRPARRNGRGLDVLGDCGAGAVRGRSPADQPADQPHGQQDHQSQHDYRHRHQPKTRRDRPHHVRHVIPLSAATASAGALIRRGRRHRPPRPMPQWQIPPGTAGLSIRLKHWLNYATRDTPIQAEKGCRLLPCRKRKQAPQPVAVADGGGHEAGTV